MQYIIIGKVMKKDLKIVLEKKQLSKPCAEVTDLQEGKKIGQMLLEYLEKSNNGVGLAANQVGIDARVCVVNVKRPIILVNPKIEGSFKKIKFQEGCLSFPGAYIITERYENILVSADNHPSKMIFDKESGLLECVCVQHEIDHLNGITMYERQIKGVSNGEG